MNINKFSSNLDGVMVSADEAFDMIGKDVSDLKVSLEPESEQEEVLLESENGDGSIQVNLNVSDEEGKEENIQQTFHFKLPYVPGGENQEELEEEDDLEVEEDYDVLSDPWKWKVKTFMSWLQTKLDTIPTHSGKDTVGIERAISYLEALDKEISKAVRMDLNNELDIAAIETARDEIHSGVDRLQERLEKLKLTKYRSVRKKKADEEYELVKEAKAANFNVNVPLFISHVARVIINSMVSAGKDGEDVFQQMVKMYDLTKREQAEILRLLDDMNYPIRRDFGHLVGEEVDTTSSDNAELIANYPG
jgi:hypothetical protein